MNIHGYKLKSKVITRLLKVEIKKNDAGIKVNRLRRAKRNCNLKIKELKQKKNENKKSVSER